MYPANAYTIRQATEDDEHALKRLAELDSARPLSRPALIGEIAGQPAAAISLRDGRSVADPFESTVTLRQLLRMRFGALQSYSRTPSLNERLRAALSPALAAQRRKAQGAES